jgi:adenylate kinase family enzyme
VSQHQDELVVFEAVAKKPHEAELFHEMHEYLGRPYIVFHINVSDEVVMERSKVRARDVVDEAHSVEKRLAGYREHTQKSIEVFKQKGTLIDIDGSKSAEEVKEEIFSHLVK